MLFLSYDITNNKHEELIIGNAYFISSIYAVKNSKRVFVKGAGMLSVGAMRSSLSIYQDGRIMHVVASGTDSNWEASSYQIKDGDIVDIEKKSFLSGQGTDIAQLLSITSNEVDLDKATWHDLRDFNQRENTKITTASASIRADVSAIMNGNISSLEGTWTNSKGETITAFTRQKEYSLLVLNTGENDSLGNSVFVLIPAGDFVNPTNDSSDSTKDLLIPGSTVAQAAVIPSDSYFYR